MVRGSTSTLCTYGSDWGRSVSRYTPSISTYDAPPPCFAKQSCRYASGGGCSDVWSSNLSRAVCESGNLNVERRSKVIRNRVSVQVYSPPLAIPRTLRITPFPFCSGVDGKYDRARLVSVSSSERDRVGSFGKPIDRSMGIGIERRSSFCWTN